MKFKSILLFTLFLTLNSQQLTAGENGLISLKSSHSVPATMDRLVDILKKKGLTIFARIDHALGAQKVKMQLSSSQLVIFGNPKMGTPLMKCQMSSGLDLPLKALVWEDKNNQTWISYNAPAFLAERHALKKCGTKVIAKMTGALKKITTKAAAK